VERAHDHAVHGAALAQVLDAGAHLAGGFVGEGDSQDAITGDVKDLHQVGDAVGEDAGLAGAGASDDQNWAVDGKHGLLLGIVQPGEEFILDGGGD
jgi:hypothetical protein